jgi:NADP-dependent aldehyde dehydrogenase
MMMVEEQIIGFELSGVEVCNAMVHGGSFPATTDSVGTTAIDRFTRSVCYQDMPHGLLPNELKKH